MITCLFLFADEYKRADKFTAAAQFGSFDLYSGSSHPGSLMTVCTKKYDPEMRQIYLNLAMMMFESCC
jgi:hypothetical protein